MKAINAIDKNKFDPTLPCNLEPFAFVEYETIIKTKHCGKIGIISFGALDYNAHYATDLGGVAMVHFSPDLLIAIKYLPWDAKLRAKEHERAVKFLQNNSDIAPSEFTKTFHYDFNYTLPAKKEQQRREYFKRLKEESLGDDVPAHPKPAKAFDPRTRSVDGEELISLEEEN